MLNYLALQLPFTDLDSRATLPKQAAVLSSSSSVRITLHAGELLSSGPVGLSSSGASSSPSAPRDIEQFGTFEVFDHVIFTWLQLMSTSQVAQAVINFVLGGSTSPPPSASQLNSLAALPVLEVQLWGGLRGATVGDVDHALSSISLSSSNTSRLLGTTLGDSFRTWALDAGGTKVDWAISAQQSGVVVDTGATTGAFETAVGAVTTTETAVQAWTALQAAGVVVASS